ncbi:unnamed protein product [Somion occarium]|uniref:Uncharacterized protein n=1 Tax=Somion occarium TaxID=3059160 RepID=A0ABP1CME3_9APHY
MFSNTHDLLFFLAFPSPNSHLPFGLRSLPTTKFMRLVPHSLSNDHLAQSKSTITLLLTLSPLRLTK